MSTPTTELGLLRAVDADDTADYLVSNLANSLTTVDSLFNNVSGHTHSAAHQGGPITSSSISGPMDKQDWYRSTGHTTAFPTTLAGLEMYYDTSSGGTVQAYNRATASYLALTLAGSTIALSGATSVNGLLTAGAGLSVTGNAAVSGALTVNGSIGGATALNLANNAAISTTAGNLYVRSSSGVVNLDTGPVNITIGLLTAGAGLAVTGNGSVSGNLTVSSTVTVTNSVSSPEYIVGISTMYIQQANATVMRYAVPATGYHSMESSAGGYAPVYASAFTPNSALKDKANLRPLDNPLAYIQDDALHAIRYNDRRSGDERIGFVADAWQALEPSLVALNTEGAVEALDYDRIGAIVFEALKQYIARTDTRLSALEDKAA
jgi:hypothetical protein